MLPSIVISLVLVVAVSLIEDHPEWIRYALAGAGFYFGFLLLVHLIYPRGMGFGDVKLAAVMGLYVGWLGTSYTAAFGLVLWAMLIGFVIGSIIGMVLLAIRRRSKQIPFGPFLALGCGGRRSSLSSRPRDAGLSRRTRLVASGGRGSASRLARCCAS